MKVEFRRSFVKDLEQARDKSLKERVRQAIERVEEAQTLQEVENVRKLRGGERYYRIRIGDYRLGLVLERDTVIWVHQQPPATRPAFEAQAMTERL